MRKMVFIYLIIFIAPLPVATYGQDDQFPPLESRSLGGDYKLNTKTEVEPYNPTPEFLKQFFGYWNKFYQQDLSKETYQGFYVYTYTFENLGDSKLKLNFSE